MQEQSKFAVAIAHGFNTVVLKRNFISAMPSLFRLTLGHTDDLWRN